MFELLEKLSLLPGVSGDEGAVEQAIRRELEGCCELSTDGLGNLIAFRRGRKRPKSKVLLDAHMDEVGFIVTHIEEDGLLRFATVGGIDGRVLHGKGVLVGERQTYGVIGAKALHQLEAEERDKAPDPDGLFLDIGTKDRAEAEQYVRPGDRAVYASDFVRFGDGFLKGRALDDRAGCALLVELLKNEPEYDLWASFTVQEETGTTGAKTAAFAVRPDCAVIVETTTAADIEGVPAGRQVCRLGNGPVISFMDKGTIYDAGLYRLAMETAKELEIPAQTKEGVYGGNNARSVQSAAGGVRCVAVSLPCRYLHSPACVLQGEDLLQTAKLLSALAERMAAL